MNGGTEEGSMGQRDAEGTEGELRGRGNTRGQRRAEIWNGGTQGQKVADRDR